jgi:eukaryotic-like serine/threonine-protein kinase
MKKLSFVLLAVLMIASSACQLGAGKTAAPTAVSLPTAAPTPTQVTLNPTATSSTGKAGDVRTSSVDGMIQVFIPDGNVRMGGMDANSKPNEAPTHEVTLTAFWMDKLEVTNGMYALCLQAGACQPPIKFTSASHPSYFNDPAFTDYPVVMVRWRDAQAYCTWAGRRLPTEAEWERAARGDDYRIFPWGDTRPDNSLSNFNYNVGDTTKVGSFPAGASPFGILDMAGNVWEWVADYYDAGYYAMSGTLNPTGPAQPGAAGALRVIRGGSYQNEENDLRVSGRGYALGGDDKAPLNSDRYNGEANNHIGFRCAADQ